MAAKSNNFGADWPDIQFAVKEACRGMTAPNEADLRKVKRRARYMQSERKVLITTGAETEQEHVINAFVDSD